MEYDQRRQEILREINSITRMERGKLCVQAQGPDKPPFYKLQCWHQGKNQTRYVPVAEVASVQAALADHERFQKLAEEFVELTVQQTRSSDASERKKNSRLSRPNAIRRPRPS
jgi:hypothetical protein